MSLTGGIWVSANTATAKVELDNNVRLNYWSQAQKIVIDECAVDCIFYRERFLLKKSWLKNLKTTGMDGQGRSRT